MTWTTEIDEDQYLVWSSQTRSRKYSERIESEERGDCVCVCVRTQKISPGFSRFPDRMYKILHAGAKGED